MCTRSVKVHLLRKYSTANAFITIIIITKQVMCRYGCPNILITDQGREFVNDVSAQLYAFTQTEHRITSECIPPAGTVLYTSCLEGGVEINKLS